MKKFSGTCIEEYVCDSLRRVAAEHRDLRRRDGLRSATTFCDNLINRHRVGQQRRPVVEHKGNVRRVPRFLMFTDFS
jgi:hypothetical protein